MVMLHEIVPGVALRLDPEVLVNHGASYNCPESTRVRGPHHFLCLGSGAGKCRLAPLYSRPKPYRLQVSRAGRHGSNFWLNGTFHWTPSQVWTAENWMVIEAATEESSEYGERDYLDVIYVPMLDF